jgi:formylglycine-generating enzyme required for sulfatase activity
MIREPDGAWRDRDDAPWMITLPAGEFTMGATNGDKFANDTERPAHRVDIAAFALGRFPVTVGEYRIFDPSHAPEDDSAWPAVRVSWTEARDYCGWLSERSGRFYRLPSEAEWEYACRAGAATAFATGNEIALSQANFLYAEGGERVGRGHRTRAATFAANGFGLEDLHGNICEWIEDVWHPDYLRAPADGSPWTRDGDELKRVIRGGAWDYLPRLLRSAWRDGLPPGVRRDNVGFRVATHEFGPQEVPVIPNRVKY